MKGIMSIIEVMITGMILFVAFLHFFPQYSIRSKWDRVLLGVKVRDTLNTIDRLGETYNYAIATGPNNDFEQFMNRTFHSERTEGVLIWWKEAKGDIYVSEPVPYFTEGHKETMIDVVNITDGCSVNCYKVYTFTLGLGYPY